MNQPSKNKIEVLLIGLLVLLTALTSLYIPLKVNNIDPLLALHESYTIAVNTYSNTTLLVGAVATGVQNATKSIAKGKYFNFFSIEPQSLLQITAPIFNLLPVSLTGNSAGSSKEIDHKQAPEPKPNSIKENLNTLSTPIKAVKKETIPEEALVNIFCSQKIGKLRRTITGSGVLINKDGTVLTNAHVAEFPLLSETNPNIVCLARYGNPAEGSLALKVAFISPEWVKEYGKYINVEGTPQTGKSDFAILKLQIPQKTSLSPLSLAKKNPEVLQKVYTTAYPADILGVKGVDSKLYQQKEALNISKMYSVDITPTDIIETTPSSKIGQRGSSGGALSDESNNLLGIIAMTVNSTEPTKKNIRALSISHIDAELKKYSNINLMSVVDTGSSELSQDFNLRYKNYLTTLLSNYLK